MALDARPAVENKTKPSGESIKQIFWQTFINEQRPKLKIQINVIELEGLVDMGADVTIIAPKSWHPGWPLQEVNVQLSGTGSLSQVKQSTRWVEFTGPEGQEN